MAIVKFSKRPFLWYFFAACFVVIVGLISANQTAIAKQLDTWQLLPRPQGITEIYFADDKQLPAVIKINAVQRVIFTVHNLEHETTTYRYKLIIIEEGKVAGQILGTGLVVLHHDQTQTVTEMVTVPTVTATRVAIKVELEYQGIPFGSRTLSAQQQSIQYWAKVVGLRA